MFRAEAHKNVSTSFCADEHAWLLALAEFLDAEAPDFVFDGIAGDVLSAALFFTPELATAFRTGRSETAAVALLRARPVAQGFGGAALKKVAPTRLRNEVRRERALHRLAKAVEPHLHAPNPIASFFFWNRTRREIALSPFALLGRRAVVFTPYLDHDLFDFLGSLPLSMLQDGRFHTDTIEWAYAHARPLRYEDKGAPKADARAHYLRFARELARWDLVRRPSPLIRPAARLRLLASALGPGGAIAGEEVGRMYCYLAQLGRATPLKRQAANN